MKKKMKEGEELVKFYDETKRIEENKEIKKETKREELSEIL